MSATPRTIAIAVKRCAQLAPHHAPQRDMDHALSEFITSSTSAGSASLPSSPHDLPVGEEEDPVGDRGRPRLVRDHHGRLAVGVGRGRA